MNYYNFNIAKPAQICDKITVRGLTKQVLPLTWHSAEHITDPLNIKKSFGLKAFEATEWPVVLCV